MVAQVQKTVFVLISPSLGQGIGRSSMTSILITYVYMSPLTIYMQMEDESRAKYTNTLNGRRPNFECAQLT
jgi:hypothetical protein